MKVKIGLIILALLIIAGAVGLVLPNYQYHQIVNRSEPSSLFKLDQPRTDFITPGERIESPPGSVENIELWQQFHLRDIIIPLPVHHPLYHVSPIVKYKNEKSAPDIGIRILKPDGRELAQIIFLPTDYFNPSLNHQKLFQVPLIRSQLQKIDRQQLWFDLFTKDLSGWDLGYRQLAYNLFLFDLRHRFLPKNTQSFYLAKNEKFALIEIASKNRDYRTELILNYQGGVVLAYILITDKQTEGALELRDYFLNQIRLEPGSKSLSRMIYKEFKTLNYQRRTELEGMTYLFSAWSHDLNNKDYIRILIENLERGSSNKEHSEQLRELYIYAYNKYKTTFSEKNVKVDNLPEEIKLMRNLELEKKRELLDERIRPKGQIDKVISKKELFYERLRRGKEKKKKSTKKVKVD